MDSCPRFVSGPLLKSSAKICDDPAETNPTEVTTIECGDEPGRLGVDFFMLRCAGCKAR